MKPKWRIGVSLLFGLLASGVVWLLVHKAQKKVEIHQTQSTVLRATTYIKQGKRIKKNMLESVSIPQAYLEPLALNSTADLLNEKGKPRFLARRGIMKGEQMTRSKIIGKDGSLGLAWSLSEGQTAVTLKLKPEQAVGGWLSPGNLVALYLTIDRQTDWPRPKTTLIYDAVQVIAVNGQYWDPSKPLSHEKMHRPMEMDYFYVTISLSPIQAAKIALAREKGSLMLGLVSPFTKVKQEAFSVTLNSLMKAE